jgi:hypothetical protein
VLGSIRRQRSCAPAVIGDAHDTRQRPRRRRARLAVRRKGARSSAAAECSQLRHSTSALDADRPRPAPQQAAFWRGKGPGRG